MSSKGSETGKVRGSSILLVAYGGAHAAKSLLWYGSELLFNYALTEIFGLSPWQAGLALAGTLALNAAAELWLGWRLARASFDLERAGRLQFAGALVTAVALMAFGVSGWAPPAARPMAVASALAAFRLSYPLLDLPQNACLALAAGPAGGEDRLSAVRMALGGLASLLVAAVFAPVLQGRARSVQLTRFGLLTLAASVLVICGAAALRAVTRGAVEPSAALSGMRGSERLRDASAGPGGLRLTLLVGCAGLAAAALSLFSRLEPYLSSYVAGGRWRGGWILTLVSLGSVLAQPGWGGFTRARDSMAGLALSGAMWAVGTAAVMAALARAQGGGLLMAAALFYGAGSGGAGMTLWAAVASRLRRSPDWTAQGFAALGAVSKLGGVGAALLAAALLAEGDYRHGGAWRLLLGGAAPMIAGAACLALGLGPVLAKRFR